MVNILTTDIIEEYFELKDKQQLFVDHLLQVVSIRESPIGNKSFYELGLSDSSTIFTHFIMIKHEKISLFDILRVYHIVKSENDNQIKFIIKKYSIYEHRKVIIGSPIIYNSNKNENNLAFSNDESKDIVNFLNDFKKSQSNNENTTTMLSKSSVKKDESVSDKVYTYIKDITSTSLTSFILLVKVVYISLIKKYSNVNGNGKYFTFNVSDINEDYISVACFNSNADFLYQYIHLNNIYEISNAYIKRCVGKSKICDFEIVINSADSIKQISSSIFTDIKQRKGLSKLSFEVFDITKLDSIIVIDRYQYINVLVYVYFIDEIENNYNNNIKKNDHNNDNIYEEKNKRNMERMVLYVIDDSLYKMQIELLKNDLNLNIRIGDIVLIKNIYKKNDLTLVLTNSSKVFINPSTNQALLVKQFVESMSDKTIFNLNNSSREYSQQDHTNMIRLKEIYNINRNTYTNTYNSSNKSTFYNIKVRIKNINHSIKNFYIGCINIKCKKKLIEKENSYYCSNCHMNIQSPKQYLILKIKVKDCSSEELIDFYNKNAEEVLGMSSETYYSHITNNNQKDLEDINKKYDFGFYQILIKARYSLMNQRVNVNYIGYRVSRVDIRNDFIDMVNEITKN